MSSWFCNLSQTILVFKCFADVFWYMYIQVKDSVVGYKKGDRLTLWKTKKLCFSNKFSHNFFVQQPGANLLIIIIKFTCFQLRKWKEKVDNRNKGKWGGIKEGKMIN